MNMSEFQIAIVNHVNESRNNLCVNAVAGSGKTTTAVLAIIQYLKSHPHAKVCCSAFNKSIAEELAERITDTRCMCKTSHSVGFMAITSWLKVNGGNTPLVKNEQRDHFKLLYNLKDYSELIDDETPNDRKFAFINNVDKLLSLCRVNLIKADDTEGIMAIAEKYGLDEGFIADEVGAVRKFLETAYELQKEKNVKEYKGRCCKVHPQAYVIDFVDMLTFGATHPQYCMKFDLFVADECQDFNKAQHELMFNSIKRGGKWLCVGDPKQAINGFAGAMNDSFDQLAELADNLPLSVNYRCGSKIIDLAKDIVPNITAHEGAIEGEIHDVDNLKGVKDGDFILCRKNAPLVMVALKFLREGRTARILGKDLGANLKSLIKQAVGTSKASKNFSPTILMDKLQALRDKTYNDLLNKGKNAKDLEDNQTLISMDDKIACIDNISLECMTIGEVEQKIDYLFAKDRMANAITLMTCHKSKGLENDNVYILLPNKLPLAWKDQKDWQAEQEQNLKYVAMTRAKKTLNWVRVAEEDLKNIEVC